MRELLQEHFAEVSLTLQLSELIRNVLNNKSHVLVSNTSGNA